MKKFIRVIEIFILKVIGFVNKIIPKSERKFLFFTNIVRFNDNNRALFNYLVKNGYSENYKIYYATPDSNDLKRIFGKRKNVRYIGIYKAIFIFVRAKYVFYDAGTIKISPSKKQAVVSMWHGTPLKKIGRTAERQNLKFESYADFSFITTTSSEFVEIFAESFECPKEKVRIMGYPRCDNLFFPRTNEIFKKLGIMLAKKIVIWMPTFRVSRNGIYKNSARNISDFELPLFENVESLEKLNEFCNEKNICLVIKLHPHSVLNDYIDRLPKFSNIFVVTNYMLYDIDIQNYELLSQCDALITDYSSVYFDYLLLNRPIYFALDDYKNSRGFTFENPLDYMCGKIIATQSDFYDALREFSDGIDGYEQKRLCLLERIHTATKTNDASKSLLDSINLSLKTRGKV